MNSYHRLAALEKSAWASAALGLGKNLLTKGVWSNVARGGADLAARGGRLGTVGRGLETGAKGMQKASPWLLGYGAAGMVGDATGAYSMPGSDLAFNLATPGLGAVMSAPSLIRTGRLAGGDYNDAMAQDVRTGAQQAGQNWMTAAQEDPRAGWDPNAYRDYLQNNGVDTAGAERYMGGRNPAQQQGAWQKLQHTFSDPTSLAMPEVQQQIYNQMGKQASLEKQAWALARQAVKGAWQAARPAAGNLGPAMTRYGAGKHALRAGAETTAAGRSLYRGLDKIPAGALPVAMTAGFALPALYDGGQAMVEDKPYGATRLQQEGYDGMQGAIRDRLGNMGQFERMAQRFDPSLGFNRMEQALPGTIAGWEQQSGQPYQQGMLGGLQQAWSGHNQSGGTGHYSYDATGERHYL